MSDETKTGWQAGQKVIMNRRDVLFIDRVTPSGRAVIGRTSYKPDGREIGSGYAGNFIHPWTPEGQAALDLSIRAAKANRDMTRAIALLTKLEHDTFGLGWNRRRPTVQEVETVERLVEMIRQGMPS